MYSKVRNKRSAAFISIGTFFQGLRLLICTFIQKLHIYPKNTHSSQNCRIILKLQIYLKIASLLEFLRTLKFTLKLHNCPKNSYLSQKCTFISKIHIHPSPNMYSTFSLISGHQNEKVLIILFLRIKSNLKCMHTNFLILCGF